jgi:hypothetical protein
MDGMLSRSRHHGGLSGSHDRSFPRGKGNRRSNAQGIVLAWRRRRSPGGLSIGDAGGGSCRSGWPLSGRSLRTFLDQRRSGVPPLSAGSGDLLRGSCARNSGCEGSRCGREASRCGCRVRWGGCLPTRRQQGPDHLAPFLQGHGLPRCASLGIQKCLHDTRRTCSPPSPGPIAAVSLDEDIP